MNVDAWRRQPATHAAIQAAGAEIPSSDPFSAIAAAIQPANSGSGIPRNYSPSTHLV